MLRTLSRLQHQSNPSPPLFSFVWTGDKALDGYSKKKYVCKLLFIFLLGHDIDFGHMEAVNLLSSNKYTEKQIVSLLVCRTDARVCVCVSDVDRVSSPGLPVHLGAGELKQRPDPPDQQRHQERPLEPQPHLHEPRPALHRQRGQQGDGRDLCFGGPRRPGGRVRTQYTSGTRREPVRAGRRCLWARC